MTSAQNQRPAWLNQLSVSCPDCSQKTVHLAIIEKMKDQKTTIIDYHFCKNCSKYNETLVTSDNYLLFYLNNLSKRIDPITKKPAPVPFDESYGAVLPNI